MDEVNNRYGSKPEQAAHDQDWSETQIISEELSAGLIAVRDVLSENFCNGGAVVARFRVVTPKALSWNSLQSPEDASRFLERLFAHPVVVEQMPEVAETNERIHEFKSASASDSFGNILKLILHGGLYGRFEGPSEDAIALVTEFMREAIGLRFRESRAWYNTRPWTSWFFGIAWDYSYVWMDLEDSAITVLLITDCD
jgi:hypothetical protein